MGNLVKSMMLACMVAAMAALAGCGGGGGGGGQSAAVTAISTFQDSNGNMFLLTNDTLGLEKVTFMCTSEGTAQMSLRAAIAQSDADPYFRTIFRIDIPQPSPISGAGGSFPVDAADPAVDIIFFNGNASTTLTTISGNVTFTSYGTTRGSFITGRYDVVVEDRNPELADPKPRYRIAGEFRFAI